VWLLGLLACPLACEPSLVVGELELVEPVCSGTAGASGLNEKGVFNDGPLPVPWETSFADGFCGFELDAGFCYGDPRSERRIVTSPVRSPPFAAAFQLGDATGLPAAQMRCAREGQLPDQAFYGAWFFLPTLATDLENWNLIHFQGGVPGETLENTWDVTLEERPGVGLVAHVYEFSTRRVHQQPQPVAVPIGRWFQLELFLKRASDETGAVALYQDGTEVLRLEEIAPDDSPFGQFYVGNLATRLNPPNYTLYVDDVSIRLSK
jgi:hypothetical protein